MDKETFSKLFLFDKMFSEDRTDKEINATFKDWTVCWDTDIEGNFASLKSELQTMKEVEERQQNEK